VAGRATLVISLSCSEKFYGILSAISKNVIELNGEKCSYRAILEFLEESGSLEMAFWFLPSQLSNRYVELITKMGFYPLYL
jgi:hypothetical protein